MKRLVIILVLIIPLSRLAAADIFRFYAPPGSASLNAAYEREALEIVQLTVEHEGVAIPQWFIAVSVGGGSDYDNRSMTDGTNTLSYQIYKEAPPSTKVLKSSPPAVTIDNVISTADFTSEAASLEQAAFDLYLHIPDSLFSAAGEYSDTVTVSLYAGDYTTSGPHTLHDSFTLAITGRMPRILDLYCTRESDIRSMDLTIDAVNRLLATVYERSNSSTGYTVAVQSQNFTADPSGHSLPYMEHSSGSGFLEYSLTYDGVGVTGWSGGSAVVTDSTGITAPLNLSKALRISYTGNANLAAGEYEDILTITIAAK